jgi:hypothetical protein
MASTITGSSSFSNSHTVPDDGDNLTAASAITPWQSLADNTRYLQQILENSGIKIVRNAASLSALKALTVGSTYDQQVCWVEGLGLFFYDYGASTTPDNAMVVQPDAGGGRWIHAAYAARGANYGLAGLSGAGQLSQSVMPTHSVLYTRVTTLSAHPVVDNGGAWTTIANFTNEILTAENAVKVVCTIPLHSTDGAGSGTANIQVRITSGSFSNTLIYDANPYWCFLGSLVSTTICGAGVSGVSTPATSDLKVEISMSSGGANEKYRVGDGMAQLFIVRA